MIILLKKYRVSRIGIFFYVFCDKIIISDFIVKSEDVVIMKIIDYEIIGKNMKAYREQLGFSMSKVAERAGISIKTYSKAEKGQTRMKLKTYLKICTALYVTPGELAGEVTEEIKSRRREALELIKDLSPEKKELVLDIIQYYNSGFTENSSALTPKT